MPAKERASVPHLGEGGAWKSPSRGRLACPPRAFSSSLPANFFFRTPTILNFRIALWPLEPWTEPWTRDHKRACVNGKHKNTRINHSSVQPSPLAMRRIAPRAFSSSLPANFFFRTATILNFRIAIWPLKPWTEPWTRDHKRAYVNGKHNNTRTNHSSAQPSPLAMRRIGNAFRLA